MEVHQRPAFIPLRLCIANKFAIPENIYLMVDQFHTLFQHPRRAIPDPALLRLRAKLIHEEAVTEG
ncbi:hypothetical protein ADT45_21195, partial [Yersinia pestis subsp. microtus bv. Caucasica]